MHPRSTSRIHFVFLVLVFVALLLLGRLFQTQIINAEIYRDAANRQYIKPASGVFDRGDIFFETKEGNRVAAATLQPTFTLVINPSKLYRPRYTYDALNDIVEVEKETFFERAKKVHDPHEVVARNLSQQEADAIEALGIVGVQITEQKKRFYPGGDLAAHVLGFVGFREDEQVGRYGVEQYYNDILARTSEDLYTNFFAELFSKLASSVLSGGVGREGDLVLTIEPIVQLKAENMLEDLKERWKSEELGMVVMDPQTGAIYAMAALPNFNPNKYAEAHQRVFVNPLALRVYEMGSIMKPLTLTAALDAGAVTPDTTYEDKGYVEVNGSRIENFDGKARGVVPMQEIFNQSLNTGAVFAQQQLGNENFREYMFALGMNEETGIEIPNEAYGLTENLKSPRDIEYATASFGQGIATTPIAMTRALAALANKGAPPNPHLVKKVEYTWGGEKEYAPDSREQVFSKEAAEEMTRMLVEVVDEALAGGNVALPQHSIAAKTGTAQIANPNGGGYLEGEFLHSFFGYFPAFEPRFLVFLYQMKPQGVRYASQTLTEPFMDMVKLLIQYYEIPPDR